MVTIHKMRNGDGREVRTVSLQTALTAVGTAVGLAMTIIMYLLGGINKEASITQRLVRLEANHSVMTERATDLGNAFKEHITWSAMRSDQINAQMTEMDLRVRLIDERVRGQYSGPRR